MGDDAALIRQRIPLWYAHRQWAEALLTGCLGLEKPEDILRRSHRVRESIAGTNWMYYIHGVGVDIYKTDIAGGIDFDFDKPAPDAWRLQIFAEKQFNDGNLNHESYSDLINDEERFMAAVTIALVENTDE